MRAAVLQQGLLEENLAKAMATYPSEKWWSSSVGMMTFPTEWKFIKMFQTTNQGNVGIIIPFKWRDNDRQHVQLWLSRFKWWIFSPTIFDYWKVHGAKCPAMTGMVSNICCFPPWEWNDVQYPPTDQGSKLPYQSNMAMEHGPFVDDLPIR